MEKIYLDNNATTRTDPRVVEAMIPYFSENYGNPSSTLHQFGITAEVAVEKSIVGIAAFFSAKPSEVVITSGTTESINFAIKGIVEHFYPEKNHIVVSTIEHHATLEICKYLSERGVEVTYIGVNAEGYVDLEKLAESITAKTALVSIIAANNEIGTVQDISAISKIVREKGALLHLDFAQGTGRVGFDLSRGDADMMSFSAHKCHGPKGIGALLIREGLTKSIVPQILGGGQQNGLRGGTLNVPLIVGLYETLNILVESGNAENARIGKFQSMLLDGIISKNKDIELNGPKEGRLVTNLNFLMNGIDTNKLIRSLRTIAFSTGSACATKTNEPSHVLTAIGRSTKQARSSVRFGIGRFTTETEIEFAIEEINKAIKNSY